MKHLKPVTKAQTSNVGTIITLVVSLLAALAPIVELIINSSQKNQTA